MPVFRIVIYGVSIILAAIEASLWEQPNFFVVHIDPTVPFADDQVQAIAPHVVIVDGRFDCTAVCPTTILRIDHHANNQSAIINNHSFPIAHRGELIDAIKHFIGDSSR